jgi:hypothetical protein
MQPALDENLPQTVTLVAHKDSDLPPILRIIARGKSNEITDLH